MSTQLDAPEPIEVINTSDFTQIFVFLLNGVAFNLTGLTEVTLTLLEKDNKTNKVFKFTTNDITLPAGLDLKQGQLQLHIGNADMAILKISDGKDLDFVCDGPWGRRTFRSKAVLSVKQASIGN